MSRLESPVTNLTDPWALTHDSMAGQAVPTAAELDEAPQVEHLSKAGTERRPWWRTAPTP